MKQQKKPKKKQKAGDHGIAAAAGKATETIAGNHGILIADIGKGFK